MTTLWEHRDGALELYRWLNVLNEAVIDPLISVCRSMQDERETFLSFMERAATGDCEGMTLAEFSGQGKGHECIKLSTLHSSKGREFKVVVMFGMDDGRIPRQNLNRRQLVEARRLFYVGFTRAKGELHMMYSQHKVSPFVTQVQKRLDDDR